MASNRQYQIAFALNSKLASGFNKSFNQATRSMQNLAKTATTAMATVATAIGAKKVVGMALTEAMNLEGFRMQLETATKSAEKAGEIMAWSVDLANRTPFETGSVVEASARLEAMGLAAQKYLPMIGDMAGATNKDLIQATEAIIDAQAGELERLKEFGIKKADIVEYAYDKMGKIQVVNNKGQITNQEKFNEAMLALMDEKFKGGMEKQASTMKGLMSTITGVMKSGMAQMVGVASDGTIKQGSLLDELKKKVKLVADTFVKWQQSGVFDKIGSAISKSIDRAINGFKQMQKWAQSVYDRIKNKILENQPLLDKMTGLINDVKDAFIKVKDGTGVFDWLKDEALPLVADSIMYVAEKALDMYTYIKENWDFIAPIIAGITAAMIANKVATLAMTAAQKGAFIIEALSKAWTFANTALIMLESGQSIATVAQWALNAAMSANPIGLVVAAIGVLIGIGVLLYKNWDKIKAGALALWEGMKTAFGNIGTWFQGKWNEVLQVTQTIWTNVSNFLGSFPLGQAFLQNITNMMEAAKQIFSGIIDFIQNVFTGNWEGAWNAVKDIFGGIFDMLASMIKAPLNAVIGIVNTVIASINKVGFTIPEWIPGIGGNAFKINIPEIPMFAKGTMNTPKGSFIAGERGPELISGAPGRRVFTHAQTKGILSKDNKSDAQFVFSPNITVQGDGISESKLAQILEEQRRKFMAEVKAMAKGNGRLAYG